MMSQAAVELERRALVMTPIPTAGSGDPMNGEVLPVRDMIGTVEPGTFTELVVVGYPRTTLQVTTR